VDPVTALATASAVFSGLKKAIELGKDAQEIYGELSKWAHAVSDVQEWITGQEAKPSIFQKISFDKTVEAEAFDEFVAKKKLQEMEASLRHEFLYGGLCHLGIDGYRELIHMRRQIKYDREAALIDQQRRRKKFIKTATEASLVSVAIGFCIYIIWLLVDIILSRGY
jgi:hypothetical protein